MIIGIGIFALITTVLKMVFQTAPRTLDDELVKMANEVNKHAPIILDSLTRLDNVMALPGHRLQYNYTITNINRDQIDTNVLIQSTKESFVEKVKNNPKAEYFRQNKVLLLAEYKDRYGAYLCHVLLTPNEYLK
jgi:hypothetical protein